MGNTGSSSGGLSDTILHPEGHPPLLAVATASGKTQKFHLPTIEEDTQDTSNKSFQSVPGPADEGNDDYSEEKNNDGYVIGEEEKKEDENVGVKEFPELEVAKGAADKATKEIEGNSGGEATKQEASSYPPTKVAKDTDIKKPTEDDVEKLTTDEAVSEENNVLKLLPVTSDSKTVFSQETLVTTNITAPGNKESAGAEITKAASTNMPISPSSPTLIVNNYYVQGSSLPAVSTSHVVPDLQSGLRLGAVNYYTVDDDPVLSARPISPDIGLPDFAWMSSREALAAVVAPPLSPKQEPQKMPKTPTSPLSPRSQASYELHTKSMTADIASNRLDIALQSFNNNAIKIKKSGLLSGLGRADGAPVDKAGAALSIESDPGNAIGKVDVSTVDMAQQNPRPTQNGVETASSSKSASSKFDSIAAQSGVTTGAASGCPVAASKAALPTPAARGETAVGGATSAGASRSEPRIAGSGWESSRKESHRSLTEESRIMGSGLNKGPVGEKRPLEQLETEAPPPTAKNGDGDLESAIPTNDKTQFIGQGLRIANRDAAKKMIEQTREAESSFDGVDMMFVEQYDAAFNEFLAQHPHFLMTNPDLIHHMRVLKLQKLLEHEDRLEREMSEQVETLRTMKMQMEEDYHGRLKEASRMKAAREIDLRNNVNQFFHQTKTMEGHHMWQLLTMSEARVKKQFDLRQRLKNTTVPNRNLLSLVPDGLDAEPVRDAVLNPRRLSLEEARHFQVDNAFLNAEVTVLQKKVAYQRIATKKYAWVESVLLRLDQKTSKKLKARYEKKLGVSF